MSSTFTLKHNVVIIIDVIFIIFSDCDYELRRFNVSYKRTSSVFTALKHRFLKEKNNVTSVSYILNKANIFLISHFFDITRLGLACLSKGICFYINVFFLYMYFLLT